MLNIRGSSQRWKIVINIAPVSNIDLFTVVMLAKYCWFFYFVDGACMNKQYNWMPGGGEIVLMYGTEGL